MAKFTKAVAQTRVQSFLTHCHGLYRAMSTAVSYKFQSQQLSADSNAGQHTGLLDFHRSKAGREHEAPVMQEREKLPSAPVLALCLNAPMGAP